MLPLGHGRFVAASRVITILRYSRLIWQQAERTIPTSLYGRRPKSLLILDALAGPVYIRSSVRPETLIRRLKEND